MGPIHLAVKTKELLDRTLEQDQGASYRRMLKVVLPHIEDAYRGEDSPFRSHLGASVLGGSCARAIWYGFRWATTPSFKGRVLRLFNRGHLEEGRIISLLLCAGIQVFQQDENGHQFRISELGGHLGGSGDGVAVGIPDLQPGAPCLLEFKTHNDASFKKLVKEGVRSAKFEHFIQMQTYMRKMQLPVALYVGCNKNDDDLHLELVYLDAAFADQYLDRGRQIIMMRHPPKKLHTSAGWYECKWCDHRPVCHLKANPNKNCRTCQWSIAREDGKWYCTHPEHDANHLELTKEDQLKGCDDYEVISDSTTSIPN